jgi:ABC-type phosphate transport system substrate-binding protein
MKKSQIIRGATAAVAFGLASAGAFAQVAVVVNLNSPITALTADQVSGIFLGRSNTLPSGGTAQPVDLPSSAPTRQVFYTKVTGKSLAQVKADWSRLVFSGKTTPPKEVATSDDVKKFVASNPGGIGYIEQSAVDSSVKVVFSAD